MAYVEHKIGGFVVRIDAEDEPILLAHRWYIVKNKKIYYVLTKIARKTTYLHRLIMMPGPGLQVDHVNRDGLDNRRCNLRNCTRSQNQCNRGIQVNNTSGYTGVSFYRRDKNWRAYLTKTLIPGTPNKYIHLGYHKTPKEAAQAYDAAASAHFGEFARLNFPDTIK